ncbi:MAG: CapA family protein [Candidatus Binataceae bacterium]
MKSTRPMLWESPGSEPAAARIASAGEFLPAGRITLGAASSWREAARALAPLFDDVSVSFAKLECVLNPGTLPARALSGIGEIVSAPSSALEYLRAIRTEVAAIANNHIFDFGAAGAARTQSAISQCAMVPMGLTHGLRHEPEVCVWQGRENLRVGFWAAAKATRDPAAHNRTGVEPATLRRAREALAAMESQNANFRVALLHAGCMRTHYPDPEDARLMDSMAQAGFDIVAASHSHRISGWRPIVGAKNRPAFCFYGLGSLVSGFAASPAEREGLVIVLGISQDGKLTHIELHPVEIDPGGLGAIPPGETAVTILNRFRKISEEIANGSFARLFYRDMSHGMLPLYWRDARAAYRQAGMSGLARKAGRVRLRHVRRLLHKVMG